MKNIILSSLTIVLIILLTVSPFVIPAQGLIATLIFLLMAFAPVIVIGFPTVAIWKVLSSKYLSRVHPILREIALIVVIAILVYGIEFLLQIVLSFQEFNSFKILKEPNTVVIRTLLLWILSSGWYALVMISFKEIKNKNKYHLFAIVTLIGHALLYLLSLYALFRLYTDLYIS